MSDTGQGYVDDLIAEYNQESGNRGVWEAEWEDVSRYTLPSYSGQFTDMGLNTTRLRRIQTIYDSTALIALPRFAAVLESMLTPRNTKWHFLAPLEPALRKDRATMLWMDEVTDILFRYRYSPTANFSGQNNQNYLSLGAFGTNTMFIDALDKSPGLRYKAVHLGEVYFFENHQGVVDKLIRRYRISARQAGQKFGKDALPKDMADKIGTRKQEDVYTFLHCVLPREDVEYGRVDYKGMAVASFHISLDFKVLVREGGYHTFPFAIGRHTQAPGDKYGRSVAMEALPATKTINEEKKTMLRQGQRIVEPVLLAHDDGVLNGVSLRNGAVNIGGVNAQGRPLIHALPTGNLAAGDAMMEMERETIKDAFLTTMFQILIDSPQKTATQVIEEIREKGVLTSPIMGRQQTEYLGPMIDRELDVLSFQRLLPPMPPALLEAGGQYKVEYDSPLSRAQRAEESTGFLRWSEMGLKFAAESQNPEVLDWVDVDAAMPELAYMQAVPTRFVRTVDAVLAIRDARSKQQQIQQAIQAGPAMAQVAKAIPSAISEAP